MKKIRSFFRTPMGTTFMFMLAVLLLMTGTVGSVRAAPQIFNPNFAYSGVELDQIGVTLRENDSKISSSDYDKGKQAFVRTSGVLLRDMLGENEELLIGKAYQEKLSVYNSGSIPEYVRVTIYKYWVDKDGNRFDAYDKDGKDVINKLIDLNFVTGNGWIHDTTSDTKERTVLYYTNVLNPGDPTTDFTDTIRIDSGIINYLTKTETTINNKTNTVYSWVADGLTFQIEAEVNCVQDHNARAAMKSAWGLTDSDIARLGINVE